MNNPFLTILIPAKNEKQLIGEVVSKGLAAFTKLEGTAYMGIISVLLLAI